MTIDTCLRLEDFTVVADGLSWPESPRWRDGELWFSDVHNFRLMKITARGELHQVADVPGRPAGLGFMPDGRPLLATALDRRLWWVDDGRLRPAADLSSVATGLLNDMVVDAQGRAWVGDTGFDLASSEPERPGRLFVWTPGGALREAVAPVRFPNGLAFAPDGATLHLAETFGRCVSVFSVGDDGGLSRRRDPLALEERPDGLCLDAEGALWVALLWQRELQRITPDGAVTHRVRFGTERVISCVIAGPERRTLYVGSADIDESDRSNVRRRGRIRKIELAVPGAGVP